MASVVCSDARPIPFVYPQRTPHNPAMSSRSGKAPPRRPSLREVVRPKIKPEKLKAATVKIRLTEGDLETFKDAAERDGRDLSSWLRMAAIEKARRDRTKP